MAVAAVVFAILAVLVGTMLLADLSPGPRLRRLAGGHVTAALAAAILVCVAALSGSAALAWLAAAAVAAAAALGVVTWRRAAGSGPVSPAMLAVHGAAAALTLLCAVLAAGRS